MRFSVVQWNIWTEKAEHIEEVINSIHPDVVCMQEVSENAPHCRGFNVAQLLARELGYYALFIGGDSPEKEGALEFHGNAILSRYPFRSAYQIPIKQAGDEHNPWDKSPRMYGEGSIILSGGDLTLATAHASFCDKFANDEIKEAEMDRLMFALDRHEDRIIFTTDLNALPGSYSYNRIIRKLKDCGPPTSENTWPIQPQTFGGWMVDSLQYRLDYVFASHELRVLDSRILLTSYSDHLPIVCTFEV